MNDHNADSAEMIEEHGNRIDTLTPDTRARFLDVLSRTDNVTEACREIQKSRAWVYHCRDVDPTFAEAWETAKQVAADEVFFEARRRAVNGYEDPVFYQGEQVGTVKRYSDRMLEMLARTSRPELFIERTESVNVHVDLSERPLRELTDAELVEARKIAAAKETPRLGPGDDE
jgi:hypothetical protein